MLANKEGVNKVSDMKRLLQAIYDDHMFVPNKEVIEQTICGKKYRYFLPKDQQDHQQWIEQERNDETSN